MPIKKNIIFKVWGIPTLMAVLTIIGLLSAIIGVGAWHILSWVALFIPLYVMVKYGVKYFK